MIPVGQVKKDLLYSQNLKDVIDVLKLIASSEFGRLTSSVPKEDALKKHIVSCFKLLKSSPDDNNFLTEKEDLPKAFLLICSDEGFLGEVNTRVVNTISNRQDLRENSEFIVLGERGAQLLEDAGLKYTSFPTVGNDIKMEDTADIINHVMRLYKKEKIGSLSVVYMQFKSFTSHHIEVAKLLPCDDLVGQLDDENKPSSVEVETLIEPDTYYVMEYLVRMWLGNSLYGIFWSSKLSEWAIKVLRLESSSEELKDITQDLKFKYFKSVHASSDKVIREIFAARAASWV